MSKEEIIIIDDPYVEEELSDQGREALLRWFEKNLSNCIKIDKNEE